MHIVLDARTVADHFPGIGRYVSSLAAALAGQLAGDRLTLLHTPGQASTRFDLQTLAAQTGIGLVAVDAAPFSAAEHLLVPRVLAALDADLYHAPYYVRPYAGLPCPSVTTLYDAIPVRFPGTISRRARLLFAALHRLAVWRSQAIITISQSARADLAALFGRKVAGAAVTPLAAATTYAPQSPEQVARVGRRLDLPERYTLALASDKPHKNFENLLMAWSLVEATYPETTLVVAGHRYSSGTAFERLIDQLGLEQRVRLLANVAEGDMAALYSGAQVFVFPSLYEGFGLPPLEAMACGTPVLAGRTSSMPEVIGDAGILIEMRDATLLARSLADLLDDQALRKEYAELGIRRASQFSWQHTARATLAVYRQATGGLKQYQRAS